MPANRRNPGVHRTARPSRDREGVLADSVAGMRSGPEGTPVAARIGASRPSTFMPRAAPYGARAGSIASPLQWIDARSEVEVKVDCRDGSGWGGTPVGAGLADGHRSGGGGSHRADSGEEDARAEGAAYTGLHLWVRHEGGAVPRRGPALLLQPRTGLDHSRRDQRRKERRRGDRGVQSV